LNRAADALEADRQRRKGRAAEEIADLLIAALTAIVTVPLERSAAAPDVRERARAQLRDTVRRRERAARRAVQEIYRHPDLEAQESAAAQLAEDVFSAQSFSVFGLSTRQLAMTGAASGALAGGLVDAALGGASLLLGAGVGAAVGAAGVLAGAHRLAKVEVLGQPLGGYELRVGPFVDANLPWVMLGRALLHWRLVAERNHARREALVLDAGEGTHLADTIDAENRRRLEALFRRVRRERTVVAETRAALAQAIAAVIQTP